ncbi:MAG TPA: glycosyltransferase family 39 protein [Vicinamibacterales bacterium]|jgi:4-amino-4-deoxy-L-arabinose transferase-like glycosyltransferase
MPRRLILAVLLLLAACPYFMDLGGSSIWDANEAFYVETPREMMERGDYIYPTFNYEPRVNKPVLSYWIVAAFFHLFGISPGVERIPIAIGGLALVAIAFFLARAAAPPAWSSEAAWWAALGLAISPRLLMFARRIFIDVYISLFMALTLLFFALAERHPSRRRLFLLLMYVSVGLGILTKGPIAALLPGLVFAIYLAVHRELGRIRAMMIPAGALIVLAIVVPWYAALYVRAGWSPIVSFMLGENVARYVEGVGVGAERPVWWYLPVVFSDSFPWSLLLVAAAIAWMRDRRGVPPSDAPFRIRTLLWIWIAVIVGFFSLSAGKQDLYIFPIVPAIVALAGTTIARGLDRAPGAPSVRATAAIISAVLAIMGAGFFLLFHGTYAVYVLAGSAVVGTIGVAGGLAALVLALTDRSRAALVVIASALIAVNWLFVLRVLPSFEAYKPAPAIAGVLKERAAPDDLIVTYNVALPSLVYYLRRHIDVFYDHGPVLELLDTRRPLYLILTSDDYERAIKPSTTTRLCRVSAHPTFDVKLRNVLSRQRMPEVLVMTNRCDGVSRQSSVDSRQSQSAVTVSSRRSQSGVGSRQSQSVVGSRQSQSVVGSR